MRRNKIDGELLKRATLFTLSFHRWRNGRRADIDKISVNADTDRLRLTKRLLESPEYDDIVRYNDTVKKWCLARCMPSYLRDGIFIVNLTEVHAFEVRLAEAAEHVRNVLVPAFVARYPQQKQASKAVLGSLYSEADYPAAEALPHFFSVSWRWISFGTPDNLPPGVREREVQKLQEAYANAQQEILAALRAGFGELINHMVDKLTVKAGEKKKVFRESSITNLQSFVDTFTDRNLMNDDELAGLVQQAHDIVNDGAFSSRTLRSSTEYRNRVKEQFENIKQQVDALIIEQPRRMLRLDEEE